MLLIDVRNDRHNVPTCAGTGPCTVPWSARLAVRFTGSAEFGSLRGFNWQIHRPHLDAEPTQPFGSDTLFLAAGRDTQATDEQGLPLWTLLHDTVTVYFKAAKQDTFLDTGSLTFTARVRGELEGADLTPEGLREIVVVNPLPPTVEFLDVRPEREGLPPCVAAEPCTIPTFTSFRVRFRGRSEQNWIRGITWSPNSEFWEPYHTRVDTLYLPVPIDTVAVVGAADTLWSVAGGIVTLYQRSDRQNPLPPRNFLLRAKVRDDARLVSDIIRGLRFITINYDPDTRLYTIPECDCPTAPPGCNSTGRVPVGWVVGIGQIAGFPEDQWRIICPGDTIPNLSVVRFYATGWDDSRDLPIDPLATTLPEVSYRFRFEFFGPDFSNTNMQFSSPPVPAQDLLPPPGTPADPSWTGRGAFIGWQTCPFAYRFEAGAVDENQRVDGTPAPMQFVVGGAPVIDSLTVPKVMVFVPRCNPNRATFCAGFEPIAFGPDTLAVYGTPVPDAAVPPWTTPLGLGWNDFVFPFRAYGHDHPRDRNPPAGPSYYTNTTEGRIRSWKFSFNCSEPGCQDLSLIGEGQWRENRTAPVNGEDSFAEPLQVRIPLDTLCLDAGCTNIRAQLDFGSFGTFVFAIQGRDTEYIAQSCQQPSDLGPDPLYFQIPIAELGRTTRLEQRPVVWRQLADVRPVHKPGAAPGVTAIRGGPFAPRKKLMR